MVLKDDLSVREREREAGTYLPRASPKPDRPEGMTESKKGRERYVPAPEIEGPCGGDLSLVKSSPRTSPASPGLAALASASALAPYTPSTPGPDPCALGRGTVAPPVQDEPCTGGDGCGAHSALCSRRTRNPSFQGPICPGPHVPQSCSFPLWCVCMCVCAGVVTT